jgi:dihydropteroate synthase
VLPAIEASKSQAADLPVSIDTFRAEVAEKALNAGADMINDISGGNLDPKMFELVADRQVPYVLMHMRGNPQNMKTKTDYVNLLGEVMKYFAEKLARLNELGVHDIIIDPGFGFAKNDEQNYHLLRHLSYFTELQVPLMAGLSRKSMIYRALDISADDALNGTVALNTMALMNGASILRVHDVGVARQTISLFKKTFPSLDREKVS